MGGEIKSLMLYQYDIAYTQDVMAIGRQQYSITRWKEFEEHQIIDQIDLEWWSEWRDFIFKTVEFTNEKI